MPGEGDDGRGAPPAYYQAAAIDAMERQIERERQAAAAKRATESRNPYPYDTEARELIAQAGASFQAELASWVAGSAKRHMDRTIGMAKPEAAAGTLAVALAVMDEDISDNHRHNDSPTSPRVMAAWSAVRAAALKSLEPPPAKPIASGSPIERAQRFVATTLDAMQRLAAEPSADAAAAVQVQSAMASVVLGGLLVEALSDRLEAIAAPLRLIDLNLGELEPIKDKLTEISDRVAKLLEPVASVRSAT